MMEEILRHVKATGPHVASDPINVWPDEFNVNDEPDRRDLGITFIKTKESMVLKRKQNKWEMSNEKRQEQEAPDVIEDSNDSVYDSSNQMIDSKQDPHLRFSRLSKRIKKDKYLTHEGRKTLKVRRNIIKFRLHKARQNMMYDLLNRTVPKVHQNVSFVLNGNDVRSLLCAF